MSNRSLPTRREMLKSAAGLGLAGLLGSGSLWPESKARSGRPLKIGVCGWMLKSKGPEVLEIARRLGLDGVQLGMPYEEGGCPLLKPEVQDSYLTKAREHKMGIAGVALTALGRVPYKSDPRAQQWVADSITISRALKTRVVLVPFFGEAADLKNDPKGTAVVIGRFKEIASQAEKAGVTLSIESWLSAEEHLAILDKVGSPAVQVYYDMGNSHKMGYDIYKEIRFLGSHISEFHAKDYDGLFGKGTIDFAEVRRAMDDIHYRGWIHIESGANEEDIGANGRYLRSLFSS
jgi:L-ribulose-5-phosphate 3-epimerase